MLNIEVLETKFGVYTLDNKIITENLIPVLNYLKLAGEYDFDMLTSIIAVDLKDKIELIYKLYSTNLKTFLDISFYCKNVAPSVIDVYKSAYFDECEIYDMFGINFVGNNNLKRLFLPESWIGHPLLKDYCQNDERLAWND